MAAGSCVTTETTYSSVKRIVWAWTASSGDAGTLVSTTTAPFDGKLLALTTIPGTGGDAPDADYDVTITDADGYDVALGAALNRHTANTEYLASSVLGAVAASKLTLNIGAAGSANKGTVILWLR